LHGVIHACCSFLQFLDFSFLLSLIQVLNFILDKLGVVQLVEQVDSVAHGCAGGADRAIQLVQRASN